MRNSICQEQRQFAFCERRTRLGHGFLPTHGKVKDLWAAYSRKMEEDKKLRSKISEIEKSTWKTIRDYLMSLLYLSGKEFSKKELEEKLKDIRKQIRAGAPFAEVWKETGGILDVTAYGSGFELWSYMMSVYLTTPLDGGKGIRLEEVAPTLIWNPDWEVDPMDMAISRNTHFWDLSERTQIVIWLALEYGERIEDMLPESVYQPVLDSNDMILAHAIKAMSVRDMEKAREWIVHLVERNPGDKRIEDIAYAFDLANNFYTKGLSGENTETQDGKDPEFDLFSLEGADESYDEDGEEEEEFRCPQKPVRRQEPKISRNAPCPCGSGLKYKHCCGKKA